MVPLVVGGGVKDYNQVSQLLPLNVRSLTLAEL